MPSPEETVTTFLSLWDKPGGLDAAIDAYFTGETVWENVGMVTTVGPEQAKAVSAGFEQQFGMAAIRVENLAVAASGNKVLTERIDHVLGKQGETLVSIRLMGIFELADGKILAWRDYFDTKALDG